MHSGIKENSKDIDFRIWHNPDPEITDGRPVWIIDDEYKLASDVAKGIGKEKWNALPFPREEIQGELYDKYQTLSAVHYFVPLLPRLFRQRNPSVSSVIMTDFPDFEREEPFKRFLHVLSEQDPIFFVDINDEGRKDQEAGSKTLRLLFGELPYLSERTVCLLSRTTIKDPQSRKIKPIFKEPLYVFGFEGQGHDQIQEHWESLAAVPDYKHFVQMTTRHREPDDLTTTNWMHDSSGITASRLNVPERKNQLVELIRNQKSRCAYGVWRWIEAEQKLLECEEIDINQFHFDWLSAKCFLRYGEFVTGAQAEIPEHVSNFPAIYGFVYGLTKDLTTCEVTVKLDFPGNEQKGKLPDEFLQSTPKGKPGRDSTKWGMCSVGKPDETNDTGDVRMTSSCAALLGLREWLSLVHSEVKKESAELNAVELSYVKDVSSTLKFVFSRGLEEFFFGEQYPGATTLRWEKVCSGFAETPEREKQELGTSVTFTFPAY